MRIGAQLYTVREFMKTPYDMAQTLEKIAENRKCLTKGGEFSCEKAAAALLDDFRSGKLGRISLEVPPQSDRT